MANVYGFCRDPTLYAEPEQFIPERFIGGAEYGGKPAERDVLDFVFGFGRRCVRLLLLLLQRLLVRSSFLAMCAVLRFEEARPITILCRSLDSF